jgi:hypothetical protein
MQVIGTNWQKHLSKNISNESTEQQEAYQQRELHPSAQGASIILTWNFAGPVNTRTFPVVSSTGSLGIKQHISEAELIERPNGRTERISSQD